MTRASEIARLDACAQAALVRSGQASPLELIEAAIDRIERLNPQLNSVIYPRFDAARAEAADSRNLPDGIFCGVPFLLKDLGEMVAGEPASWGWKPLKDIGFKARSTAHVAEKFRDAGLITLGRTTVPEWGPSLATETAAWGATRNPWNLARGVGGSSGGAAASVASGMVPIAHANDAGGSIRIPASFCGLVGLKPSRGRTSNGPAQADIWHGLGEHGVVARSVRDAAAALDVISGYCPGDPFTAPAPTGPFRLEAGKSPAALRIGFMDRAPSFHPGIDSECAGAVRNTAKLLEALGHRVEQNHPAVIDDENNGKHVGVLVATSEALTAVDAEKILGRPLIAEDFDPWTWWLIERGRSVSAVRLLLARQWVNDFTRATARWWSEGFDILLTSTLATPPPPIGVFKLEPGDLATESGRRQAVISPFTIPWNAAGNPAISLPLQMTRDGMPIGIQLVAAYGREDLLLRLAAQIEQAAPWFDRYPPLFG